MLETLAAVASKAEGPIHLIGHSTGGLDARLAIAPTASLPSKVVFDAYDRVKTLVTVCTPHYGTPVATYFTRPVGRFLIRTVGRYLIFMLERGQVPLKLLLRLGYLVVRARDPFRKRRGAFDELYDKLLSDLSEPRILELATFLKAVVKDQSLLFQLTPAGCDLLNACTRGPEDCLRLGGGARHAAQLSQRLAFAARSVRAADVPGVRVPASRGASRRARTRRRSRRRS